MGAVVSPRDCLRLCIVEVVLEGLREGRGGVAPMCRGVVASACQASSILNRQCWAGVQALGHCDRMRQLGGGHSGTRGSRLGTRFCFRRASFCHSSGQFFRPDSLFSQVPERVSPGFWQGKARLMAQGKTRGSVDGGGMIVKSGQPSRATVSRPHVPDFGGDRVRRGAERLERESFFSARGGIARPGRDGLAGPSRGERSGGGCTRGFRLT